MCGMEFMSNKIFIITAEPFPVGMACTNRILSYCRGFVENNARVKVICLKPSERFKRGIANKESRGIYNGIDYEYSSGTTIRGKTFIKRRLQDLKGAVKAFYILKKANAVNKIDALILVSNSLGYIIYFFIITKILSITYIQEKSEFPFVLRNQSLFGKIYAKFYTSYAYKAFDAILIMTRPLKRYFQSRIRKNSKLLLVPMTVEQDRFLKSFSIPTKSDYIAYCGSPNGDKDGVPILIKAFSIISKKYKTIKLYIIGDTPGTNVLQNLKKLAKKINVEHRVVFTGVVNRDRIPEYLCNASILALARPTSLQAKGGFPTKLGEYLATGNPVVVTKVGEIPDYLKDGESAFLSKPDSAEAFAEKLDYVLLHPEIAKRVGLKGREVAFEYFNYKTQAKRIINFIDELNQR